MKTIKTSREFRGPISIRVLSALEGRSVPLSILDIVSTDGARHFSGQISTGDVDCTWEMTVWQNGFWFVKGDFHDGGVLAGDFFVAEFLLGRDHSVGAKLEGSILNLVERHTSVSANGTDRWIRDNWYNPERSGLTVRLHADPALAGIAASAFIALAIGFKVVFGGGIEGGHRFESRPCDDPDPEGRACIHTRVDPPLPENENDP